MHIQWAFSVLVPLASFVHRTTGAPIDDQSEATESWILGGNHSAATNPFWKDYDYCQPRHVTVGSWMPLADAAMVKLQVMHRHGARVPVGVVPGDDTEWYECGNPDEFVFMNQGDEISEHRSPFMKEHIVLEGPFASNLWQGNCDIGQLTSMGKRQLRQLGQTLRALYVDFFNFLPMDMQSNLQISHTHVWRTRESVENLFQGLYPLENRAPDRTLTMHVKPSTIEVMTAPTPACPKLAKMVKDYHSSAAFDETLEPYRELEAKLATAYNTTGVAVYNTSSALHDVSASTYCHGLGIKPGLTLEDVATAMIPGTSSHRNLYRQNPEAEHTKRLAVGPWLSEILASFYDYSSPLQIYSAHDLSLDMFLAVVGESDLPWPPYSSTVVMELWRKNADDSLVVRMFYEGMVVPAHPDLACDLSECPLETLEAFLEKYIPTDFHAECQLSEEEKAEEEE